jgi:nitroreductase
METLKAIQTRRSVRKYLDKSVSDDLVTKIVTAGMYAPSAHNEQPWHFVIIKKKEILQKIPTFLTYASMCLTAPCAIAICGDSTLEKSEGRWPQDCAAATQNILLAIHDLDLGGVWSGLFPRKEAVSKMQELLKLPVHIVPFSLVVLGYPAEQPKQPDRFIKERIHYEGW